MTIAEEIFKEIKKAALEHVKLLNVDAPVKSVYISFYYEDALINMTISSMTSLTITSVEKGGKTFTNQKYFAKYEEIAESIAIFAREVQKKHKQIAALKRDKIKASRMKTAKFRATYLVLRRKLTGITKNNNNP